MKLTVSKHQLGGDDIVIALEITLLESFPHDDLGFSLGVDLSCIEEVDAVVPSFLDACCSLLNFLHALVGTICEPSSETKNRNFETCVTEVSKEHVLGLKSLPRLRISLIRHFGGWCLSACINWRKESAYV